MTRGQLLSLALAAVAAVPARAQTTAPASPSSLAAALQPGVQPATDTTTPPGRIIGWIHVAQTRSGLLEDADFRMGDGTYCDIWYLDGTAGQRVVIELHSRAFDAYLQLLDPGGVKVAENTDGAGNHDSRIRYTLLESGRYQIIVNNETDDVGTGPYTVVILP